VEDYERVAILEIKRLSMVRRKKPMTEEERAKQLAELRRDVAKQKAGYRAKALALYPHLCASCGREFSIKRLKELTVHHKDHNHENNPQDGSNWELLCIYCHDHEHEKRLDARHINAGTVEKHEASTFASPFEGLDSLMGKEKNDD
jgi:5-methylcytosine-specific restriction endonuclease McrA